MAAQVENMVVKVHHVGTHPRLKRRDAAGVQGSMAALDLYDLSRFMQDLPACTCK